MIDNNRIQGTIESIEIKPGESTGKFEALATVVSEDIWTDCILCNKNVYTKHRFMDEGLCAECRETILERFKLIIDFK